MAELKTAILASNEVAKTDDMSFIGNGSVENAEIALKHVLGPFTNKVIVYGLSVQQRGTPSMNVDVTAGGGIDGDLETLILNTALAGPVAIAAADPGSSRIDIIEMRQTVVSYDTQQRAFRDPVPPNPITYANMATKNRYVAEFQAKSGTPGAGVAPTVDSGWVKIAEVVVGAGVTTILDANIHNCTGGYDGEVTTLWTTETSATFRVGSFSDFKTLFRARHTAAGEHTASNIPLVDTGGYFTTNNVEAALQQIGAFFTNLAAADVAVVDAGGYFTASDVEGVLQEIGQKFVSYPRTYDTSQTPEALVQHEQWTITAGGATTQDFSAGAVLAGTKLFIRNTGTGACTVTLSSGVTTLVLAQDQFIELVWDGTHWCKLGGSRFKTVLASGTGATWVVPFKGTYDVLVVGGGGGGGGAKSTSASYSALAGGGNGGGLARKRWMLVAGVTLTYTVGTGGGGGTTTPSDGSAGGTTQIGDGTTTVSATGGAGGIYKSASSSNQVTLNPGAPGVGANGDENRYGGMAKTPVLVPSYGALQGIGGDSGAGFSYNESGGPAWLVATGEKAGYAQNDLLSPGCGGDAGAVYIKISSAVGGEGANGVIVIEY